MQIQGYFQNFQELCRHPAVSDTDNQKTEIWNGSIESRLVCCNNAQFLSWMIKLHCQLLII